MNTLSSHRLLAICYLLLAISFLFVSACTHAIPRFGVGGRYEEGKEQFLKGRGGDMDRAVVALESVVREDPVYKDSLTFLGRAYYRKGRYQDAYALLQRALAVNKGDEIAWLALGLTQLRLEDDEKGLETMKGAITLVSKVAKNGYHGYPYWDKNGLVSTAIRRTVLSVTKGLEEKQELIRNAETLLARIDEEENYQRKELPQQLRRDFGG